nr:hypothetical protein [Tanacetum cinerariifolium]
AYVTAISSYVTAVNDITRLQALVDMKKWWLQRLQLERVDTPLFEGMLVEQEVDEEGDVDECVEEVTAGDDAHGDDILDACATLTRRIEYLEYDKVAQALEIAKLKRRVKKLEKRNKGRMSAEIDKDDAVVLMDDKDEDKKVEEAKEDENETAKVQEVVDVVTTEKLIPEVVTAAGETVTAASAIIPTTEPQVPATTLTAPPARVVAAPSRRRKGVVIKDPKEESTTSTIIPAETKSKDKGKGILIEEPKPLKKKQ